MSRFAVAEEEEKAKAARAAADGQSPSRDVSRPRARSWSALVASTLILSFCLRPRIKKPSSAANLRSIDSQVPLPLDNSHSCIT